MAAIRLAIVFAILSYPLSLLWTSLHNFHAMNEDLARSGSPPIDTHEERVNRVLDHVKEHGIGNKIQKKTNSNRFEYGNIFLTMMGSINSKHKMLPMEDLRNVLEINTEKNTVTVEGGCTMRSLAETLIPKGFMLPIHPEVMEITVGGAIAGIGIESSGHKYGFFHDNVLEVDVLCADGQIKTASEANDHADLFYAMPNSFGTLGYIVKAKLHLAKAAPYVHMRNRVYTSLRDLHADMGTAAESKQADFLEALVFNETYSILSQTNFVYEKPELIGDIFHGRYHKLLQLHRDLYLPMQDYIFRFEPDLFFNWEEENAFQDFLRWALPPSLRNSRAYRAVGFHIEAKIEALKDMIWGKSEPLIQDWEIPWHRGYDFLLDVLAAVKLPEGKPWLVIPIRPQWPTAPTNFPVKDVLYLNLGVYLKNVGADDRMNGGFGRTKFIDSLAFKFDGLKMLYSTSFATKEQYMQRFNGEAYDQVKQKYDSLGKFKTIFEKCFNNIHR